MAIALDGTPVVAVSTIAGSTTGITAPAFTTVAANDIVVAIIHGMASGATVPILNTPTGGGLTWTRQSTTSSSNRNMGNGAASQILEVWWALKTAAGAVTVAATFTVTIDSASIVVFGFSGANTTTPFDGAGVSGTAVTPFTTATVPTVTGFSTTTTTPMAIIAIGCQDGPSAITASAGYTRDGYNVNSASFSTEVSAALHGSFGSAFSSATVTTTGNEFDWLMLVAALQPAAAGDVLAAQIWL